MSAATIIFVVIALVVGAVIGWLVGARGNAGTTARLSAVTEQRDRALSDIDKEQERARSAEIALEGLRAGQQAEREAFEDRLKALSEAREQLSAQFSEIGGRLLGEAQKAFLERADARFGQAQEKGEAQLKALLAPVHESISRYDQKISAIEAARTEAYGTLTGLIGAMRDGQEAVRSEAAKLVNSLRAAPKARGRWGEQQLRNVLESCGLSEFADFETEVSVEGADGRLRPDVVIRVPGGQSLVVDAKVSLNSYQDAFGAADDGERTAHLAKHTDAMRDHINTLGRKEYWSQFAAAPDYVIMFVPGEHFLSAALDHDPTLWDFAFKKQVLLATPTNLIAIARTVAAVWRQEKMAEEAQAIGALGKELYERLAVAAGHLRRLGAGINALAGTYNAFAASFESRVLVTGRKLRDMNVDTAGRELEVPGEVGALAREPMSEEARAGLPKPESSTAVSDT